MGAGNIRASACAGNFEGTTEQQPSHIYNCGTAIWRRLWVADVLYTAVGFVRCDDAMRVLFLKCRGLCLTPGQSDGAYVLVRLCFGPHDSVLLISRTEVETLELGRRQRYAKPPH